MNSRFSVVFHFICLSQTYLIQFSSSLKMCRYQKEIIICAQAENFSVSSSTDTPVTVSPFPMIQEQRLHFSEVQISDDRAQVIRSNKNLLKKNLRNSLQIRRTLSFLNNKEQDRTAASLKDLGSDKYLAFEKACLENTDSSSGSIKMVIAETQKIIEKVFDEKYQILNKIGQGNHSTVYKVLCKVDNKVYALKKIKNVSFQNWKKMKNHFRMVKILNHEKIIKYTDFHSDQQKRTIFVVMQFCKETDLRSEMDRRLISGKSFDSKEIVSISKQLASVLKYLHAQGICHRDLKPENILYNNETQSIKVIDLDVCGVKKFREHKFDMWTNTGTLLYRAPETFGVGYGEKIDIWSLGTLIYELISGEVPFKTQYQKDFLQKVIKEEADIQNLRTSKKVKNYLSKCLEKDPKKRISAGELIDQLEGRTKTDQNLTVASTKMIQIKYWQQSDSERVCLGSMLKF